MQLHKLSLVLYYLIKISFTKVAIISINYFMKIIPYIKMSNYVIVIIGFYFLEAIKISNNLIAASGIGVPGPKIATTPASNKN